MDEKTKFIVKSNIIHNNKYDYSKVDYKNSYTKVIITCPTHGDFDQIPYNHIRGSGCKKCAIESSQIVDQEAFIKKAKYKHKNKYDYSKVKYTGIFENIIVICPKHGEFEQSANVHLRSSGCPQCGHESSKILLFKPEQFTKKSNKIHNNKYDYSKVKYKNSKTKVTIVCPKHGEFEQLPSSHMRGYGCPKCTRSNKKLTTQEFIKRSKKTHGNKYDYSKSKYENSSTKVKIICLKHGEFEQYPRNHINGGNCPLCIGKKKSNIQEFIKKSKEIHDNKYDYTKAIYVNNSTKVIIICPEHGEFKQTPHKHLSGQGCKKCAYIKTQKQNRLSIDEFIQRARENHGDKYDYSLVDYQGINVKIKIICPKHGEFEQTPSEHIKNKFGCLQCANENTSDSLKFTTEQFIERSKLIHGDKYDYSKTIYNKALDKLTIICQKHGEFKQLPIHHWRGVGCPKCSAVISSGHQQVIDFIQSIYDSKVEINDRMEISPYELDIYIPELSLAIEYNGVFYHSYDRPETPKEKNRHRDKHLLCKEKDILLIQINEHEWIEKSETIKSTISHKLGLSNRIFARKCKIVEINNKEHKQFMDTNHIYGHGRCSHVSYGLEYDGDLVCVMSFNKHHKYQWEINRLASKLNHVIIGGADKLFKHFIKNHKPDRIMTYADARFGCGDVYKQLGFKLDGMTSPGYGYIRGCNYYKRQEFQKHKLRNKLEIFDQNLTEAENMFNNGYARLWDAGHYRFVWVK